MKSAFVLIFSLVSLFQIASTDAKGSLPPNIVLIVSDDLATRVGCYGDASAITPHLDRLAEQGMVFEKAYVQGTVCTPSRTAFMLGLNNRSARRNHFVQHPDTLTMGRFFRQNGYQTFSVGKIDHTEEFVDPLAWEIRDRDHFDSSQQTLLTLNEPGKTGRKVWRYSVAPDSALTHDRAIADRAIRFFVEERDTQRPFFAAIGFHKPHQPAVSTQRHFDAHGVTAAFPFLPTPPDASPVSPGHLYSDPGIVLTEQDAHLARRTYYASVSHMDEELGRVLDTLERMRLMKNTLVIFTSDHGYHLGWRGQWAKHDLSEEVMRVPLIACWPGVTPPGTRTKGIVELIDLFPTFAEAAGLPIPESLDGKSFVAQLRDPTAPGKPAAFCDDGRQGRTIRTTRWRLTERIDGTSELYDHTSDAGEFHNLYGTPGHEQIAARLARQLAVELGPRPHAGRPNTIRPERTAPKATSAN